MFLPFESTMRLSRWDFHFFWGIVLMCDIREIVTRIESGESSSAEELLPLVYKELKSLASNRLAKERNASLQTTELVHEAYLRLVGPDQAWSGRSHFFGAAAEAMRRVLVDRARSRGRAKRGGGRQQVEFPETAFQARCSEAEILAVNDLFDALADSHPQEAEVAKLRYFANFSLQEVANALDISVGSAHNYWKFARAWLYRELSR